MSFFKKTQKNSILNTKLGGDASPSPKIHDLPSQKPSKNVGGGLKASQQLFSASANKNNTPSKQQSSSQASHSQSSHSRSLQFNHDNNNNKLSQQLTNKSKPQQDDQPAKKPLITMAAAETTEEEESISEESEESEESEDESSSEDEPKSKNSEKTKNSEKSTKLQPKSQNPLQKPPKKSTTTMPDSDSDLFSPSVSQEAKSDVTKKGNKADDDKKMKDDDGQDDNDDGKNDDDDEKDDDDNKMQDATPTQHHHLTLEQEAELARRNFKSTQSSQHDLIKGRLSSVGEINVLDFRFPWILATKKQTTVQTASDHSFPLVDLTYINTNVTNDNDIMGDSIRDKSRRAGFKVDEFGHAQQRLKMNQWLYGTVFQYPKRLLFDPSLLHYKVIYAALTKSGKNLGIKPGKNDAFGNTNGNDDDDVVAIDGEYRIIAIEPHSFQRWSDVMIKNTKLYSFAPYAPIPGFVNSGNTCYLNSALQQIMSSPPLTSFLLATCPNWILIKSMHQCALVLKKKLLSAGKSQEGDLINKYIIALSSTHEEMTEMLHSEEYKKQYKLSFFNPKYPQKVDPLISTEPSKTKQLQLHSLVLQLDESNPLHMIPFEKENVLYQLARNDPHRIYCPRQSEKITNKRTGATESKHCSLCSLSQLAVYGHGFNNQIDTVMTRYICEKNNLDYNTLKQIYQNEHQQDLMRHVYNKAEQQAIRKGKNHSRGELKDMAAQYFKKSAPSFYNHEKSLFSSLIFRNRHTPSQISNHIRNIMSDVSYFGSQEDSQECLQALLDTADTAWVQSTLIPFPRQNEDDLKQHWWDIAPVRGGGKTHREASYNRTSPIQQLIGGSSLHSVTCSHCHHVSSTVQYFTSLTLDLPPQQQQQQQKMKQGQLFRPNKQQQPPIPQQRVTLQDCFKQTFKPTVFSGDNAYSCDQCKVKRTATKTIKFLTIPNVLFIHLNRFTIVGFSQMGAPIFRKISTPVFLQNEQLDLSPYMDTTTKEKLTSHISNQQSQHGIKSNLQSRGLLATPTGNNSNSNTPVAARQYTMTADDVDYINSLAINKNNNFMYNLQATAVHAGQMNGGHYYSYVNLGESMPSSIPAEVNAPHLGGKINKNAINNNKIEILPPKISTSWYEIDDDETKKADFGDVNSGSAYVLTFTKQIASIPHTQILSSQIELLLEHQDRIKQDSFMVASNATPETTQSRRAPLNLAQLTGSNGTFNAPTGKMSDIELTKVNQLRLEAGGNIANVTKGKKNVAVLLAAAESSEEEEVKDESDDEDEDDDEDDNDDDEDDDEDSEQEQDEDDQDNEQSLGDKDEGNFDADDEDAEVSNDDDQDEDNDDDQDEDEDDSDYVEDDEDDADYLADDDEDVEIDDEDQEDDEDRESDESSQEDHSDNDEPITITNPSTLSSKQSLFAKNSQQLSQLESKMKQKSQEIAMKNDKNDKKDKNDKNVSKIDTNNKKVKKALQDDVIGSDMLKSLHDLSDSASYSSGEEEDEDYDSDFIDDEDEDFATMGDEDHDFMNNIKKQSFGVQRASRLKKQREDEVRNFNIKKAQMGSAWLSDSSSDSSDGEMSSDGQNSSKKLNKMEILEKMNRNDLKTTSLKTSRDGTTQYKLSKQYVRGLDGIEADEGDSTDDEGADYTDDIDDGEKISLQEYSEVSESEAGSPGEWVATSEEEESDGWKKSKKEKKEKKEKKSDKEDKKDKKSDKSDKKDKKSDKSDKKDKKSPKRIIINDDDSENDSPSNPYVSLAPADKSKILSVKNRIVINDDSDSEDEEGNHNVNDTFALPSLQARFGPKSSSTISSSKSSLSSVSKKTKITLEMDDELIKHTKGQQLSVTQRNKIATMSANERSRLQKHQAQSAAAQFTGGTVSYEQAAGNEDDGDSESDQGRSMYLTEKEKRKKAKQLEKEMGKNVKDSNGVESAADLYTTLQHQMLTGTDDNDIAHKKDGYERGLDAGRLKKVRGPDAGKDKVWAVKRDQMKIDEHVQKRKQPYGGFGGDDGAKFKAKRQRPSAISSHTGSAFEQKAIAMQERDKDISQRHKTVGETFEQVDYQNKKAKFAIANRGNNNRGGRGGRGGSRGGGRGGFGGRGGGRGGFGARGGDRGGKKF